MSGYKFPCDREWGMLGTSGWRRPSLTWEWSLWSTGFHIYILRHQQQQHKNFYFLVNGTTKFITYKITLGYTPQWIIKLWTTLWERLHKNPILTTLKATAYKKQSGEGDTTKKRCDLEEFLNTGIELEYE